MRVGQGMTGIVIYFSVQVLLRSGKSPYGSSAICGFI